MEKTRAAMKRVVTPSNIILIITLLASIVAAFAKFFMQSVSAPEQLQMLFVILGLLVSAQLVANYSTTTQEEKWHDYHKTQETIANIIKDFPLGRFKHRRDIVPLEQFAANAEGILIIARTANKVAGRSAFFQKKLEHGCKVRFVIANPEAYHRNDIEAVTPLPLTGKQALRAFNAEVTATFNNIRLLQKFSANTPGKVEVRLVNYISNLSFILVDDGNGRGRITIELMPYKCQIDDRPYVELKSQDPDDHWYAVFKNTCEDIWEHAACKEEVV